MVCGSWQVCHLKHLKDTEASLDELSKSPDRILFQGPLSGDTFAAPIGLAPAGPFWVAMPGDDPPCNSRTDLAGYAAGQRPRAVAFGTARSAAVRPYQEKCLSKVVTFGPTEAVTFRSATPHRILRSSGR